MQEDHKQEQQKLERKGKEIADEETEETKEEEKNEATAGLEIYYWESCEHSSAGHLSIKIVNSELETIFVGFYLNEERPKGGCAEGRFIELDEERKLVALRTVIVRSFAGLRCPPTTIEIYLELLKLLDELNDDESEEKIDKEQFLNQYLEKMKNDKFKEVSEEDLKLICETAFDEWIKNAKIFSAENGTPHHTLKIDFLDNDKMYQAAAKLKQDPHIKWDSIVGLHSDELLEAGLNPMTLFAKIPKVNMQGYITHHQKGDIRYNCSSIVLRILEEGGIFAYANDFNETPYFIESVHTMLDIRAKFDLELQKEKQQKHSEIDSLSKAHTGAKIFSIFNKNYRHPFLMFFGVPPTVVFELAKHAQKNYAAPAQNRCIVC